MMTSSNGNIFRVTGPLCGEFTGPGEFPTQRPVTRSFDVIFDLRLNKRLSKQPWGWWFETPSRSLWRQRNDPIVHIWVQIMLCLMWNGNLTCILWLSFRGPLYQHGLTLIPAWISNYIPRKVWCEITYPFINFNGCIVDVQEWKSNFTPHFMIDAITYPCLD